MNEYNAMSGKLHLVLAAENDCYDLPTMIRMESLDALLYYRLTESGFKRVLFVYPDAMSGSAAIRMFSEDDANRYNEIKNSLTQKGHGLFAKDKPYASGTAIRQKESHGDVFLARISREDISLLLKLFSRFFCKEDATAIAVPLAAFSEFLSDSKKRDSFLKEWNSAAYGNIMLLTASAKASESFPYLFGEASVLPQLDLAFPSDWKEDAGVNPYRFLKQRLGSACHFPGALTEERFMNTLNRTAFSRGEIPDPDMIQAEARLLSVCCTSEAFRAAMEQGLPSADGLLMRSVENDWISKPNHMKKLADMITEKGGADAVYSDLEQYCPDPDYAPVYASSKLKKQMLALIAEAASRSSDNEEEASARRGLVNRLLTCLSLINNVSLYGKEDLHFKDAQERLSYIGNFLKKSPCAFYDALMITQGLEAMMTHYFDGFETALGIAGIQLQLVIKLTQPGCTDTTAASIREELRKYSGYYEYLAVESAQNCYNNLLYILG